VNRWLRLSLRAASVLAASVLISYLAGCRVMWTPEHQWPVRVFRAEPLEPEGWYRTVYDDVVKCVGKSRPYGDVEWYVVGAGRMGDWIGLFSPPNRIYLDERHVMDGYTLGHELLHYVTELGDEESDFQGLLNVCGYERP
jgi:hypothetical protein